MNLGGQRGAFAPLETELPLVIHIINTGPNQRQTKVLDAPLKFAVPLQHM